jgi:hypothetical protein
MTGAGDRFSRFYWIACGISLILVIIRCATVPFYHDEAATFYYYIQPGSFMPFYSHPDANGHFLMSATGWLCFKLFGSSAFSLRLPSVFSFIILCYAVFRICGFFGSIFPKLIFSVSFILCFHFIALYSLCRGYGLSMSFLMLALYYLLKYRLSGTERHLLKFVLFSQLALAANLTLVVVLVVCDALALLLQIRLHRPFSARVLAAWLVNLLLLGFWVQYGFYLNEKGALYYGEGDSYWKVTFLSLIEMITVKNHLVTLAFILLFLEMLVYWIYALVKRGADSLLRNEFQLCFFAFICLIAAFFLLRNLFHVNYPEDRTGLFFYLLFMLSLAFMINEFRRTLQPVFLFIPLFYSCHFVFAANLRVHPWKFYETFPESFFQTLVSEQKKSPLSITVAGHRVKELIYGFMNYNSPVKLNHMTSPEALQMNCDYAIASKLDKPWYDPYYSEMAHETDWNMVLLKRKSAIARRLLFRTDSAVSYTGTQEFFNACERFNISFSSQDPLLAEFSFGVENAPMPFHAWLVLELETDEGKQFVRTPLDLIRYDWKGVRYFTTSLVSGNVSGNLKRIVAYLWNIDKADIRVKLHSFRLFQLEGEGVREISGAKL